MYPITIGDFHRVLIILEENLERETRMVEYFKECIEKKDFETKTEKEFESCLNYYTKELERTQARIMELKDLIKVISDQPLEVNR